MGIPLRPKVAAAAVEVLTNPRSPSLSTLCPNEHPLLLAEHLDYARKLMRLARKYASQIQAEALTEEEALVRLKKWYGRIPEEARRRALAFALEND